MRVLHVLEALGGGTARHIEEIVGQLKSVEHAVVVPPSRTKLLSDSGAIERLRVAGAQVEVIKMHRSVSLDNLRAIPALRAIANRWRADVVHAHAAIAGGLSAAANRGQGRPLAWTPHAVMPNRLALLATRFVGHEANHVIALSASEAKALTTHAKISPAKVTTIPNGVDLTSSEPAVDLRARLNLPTSAKLVGTVARLDPQKDPETFVRMAGILLRNFPEVHFVIVGDGQLRERVLRLAARLRIEDRFHLFKMDSGAHRTIDSFDIFVSTSTYEGGPYVPLEAMRRHVPVVMSDCVGNADLVSSGRTGLLFAVGSAQAAAWAVSDLLGNATKAAQLSTAAYESLAAQYDLQKTTSSLQRLYLELVRHSAVPARWKQV